MPSLDPTTQQAEDLQPSLCFPMGRAETQVCDLPLVHSFGLVIWLCSLAMCQNSLLPLSGMHTEGQPQSGCGCGWDVPSAVCVHASGRIQSEAPPVAPGWASWWNLQHSRSHIPLMLPEVPSMVLPDPSHLPVMQLMTEYSGCGGRELALFGMQTQLGKPGTYSNPLTFLCGRNCRSGRSYLVFSYTALGKGWSG